MRLDHLKELCRVQPGEKLSWTGLAETVPAGMSLVHAVELLGEVIVFGNALITGIDEPVCEPEPSTTELITMEAALVSGILENQGGEADFSSGAADDLFSDLAAFIGGYFHQDWNIVAPTAGEVLEEYVSLERELVVLRVIAEVSLLIEWCERDDKQVRDAVLKMGGAYVPDEEAYINWLFAMGNDATSILASRMQSPRPSH